MLGLLPIYTPTACTAVPEGPSMHCPHCGADAPDGARFCIECGISLQRRVIHERVAQAVETRFRDGLEEWYSTLAHHYSRSGNTTKAVAYLNLSGQWAVRRSAYAEAVNHLTAAADLLTTLPETRKRTQQELVVQMTLGMALRGIKGSNTPEVEQCYLCACTLCEQVGEPPQLFHILWGLWMIYNQRGDAQTMRTMAEQL